MNKLPVFDATTALFLKEIAASKSLTRVELSRISGLTKSTVSGVVSSLIDNGYITEKQIESDSDKYLGTGRRPTVLYFSEKSPLVCGMLVHRGCLSVSLATLDGTIYKLIEYPYETITADMITQILVSLFFKLKSETERKILGIGIACPGPIDIEKRAILKPNNFYGIENYNIADEIEKKTSMPVFMQNDINAAAVAEALFGNGKNINNFIYLHLKNGIGTGTVINGRLYSGNTGNAGDIAHMTVNIFGKECTCGSIGCLESYANIDEIRSHISRLSDMNTSKLSFRQVVSMLNNKDIVARSAMQEYVSVLSVALSNMLRCLDISTLIFGYDGCDEGNELERMLDQTLQGRMANSGQSKVSIKKSAFFEDAALIGASAIVTYNIFENSR